MEELTRDVHGGLQLMVQGARTTVDRWRRRVMAAEDSEADGDEDLLFCVASVPRKWTERKRLFDPGG